VLTLLFRLLAALPLRSIHAIGGTLGRCIYWVSPTFRRRLHENLATAGYADAGLARQTASEAGKQALETPWVWMRPRAQMLSRVAADSESRTMIETALADGRPVVFLTPHLGCFEITAQWIGAVYSPKLQRPLTVLYRVPRKAVLRRIVAEGRNAEHVIPAPADVSGVRKLIRAMRNRELVGILPDQVPTGGDGVWAPFFGRAAYTMTLPAKLARQFDGIVLYIWGERLPAGAGWRIHLRPLTEALSGDAAHDAAALNRGLEQLIRAEPRQYLWSYNRYKVPGGVEPPPVMEASA
jgi:KDO2-lipid IV(A) lauroyltransferase